MLPQNPLFDLPCVIFAGGKSSRMGRDKALLAFGGFSSLAEFQYRRLSKLFKEVYISTKEAKFTFDAPLILDNDTETYAPTTGFVSSFQALQCERIFVLSVDTPFVSEKEIQLLLEHDCNTLDAVIAKTALGSHPLCGIYHTSLLPKFQEMLVHDTHKLGFLLKNVHTTFVPFSDEAPFENLNHPQEYEVAKSRL